MDGLDRQRNIMVNLSTYQAEIKTAPNCELQQLASILLHPGVYWLYFKQHCTASALYMKQNQTHFL